MHTHQDERTTVTDTSLTPNETLAALLIELFSENPGVPHTRDSALEAIGYEATTRGFRGAMRKARRQLEKIGLLVPPAVPSEGHVYLSTDKPTPEVFAGVLHVSRTIRGLELLNIKLHEFVLSNTQWCEDNPELARTMRRSHRTAVRKIEDDNDTVTELSQVVAIAKALAAAE